MIIHDFGAPCFAFVPDKAYPPLPIDADGVLSLSLALQRLKTIAGRRTQIVQFFRRVDHQELSASAPLNLLRQVADSIAGKHRRRALVGKALYHIVAYRFAVRNVNRTVPWDGTRTS